MEQIIILPKEWNSARAIEEIVRDKGGIYAYMNGDYQSLNEYAVAYGHTFEGIPDLNFTSRIVRLLEGRPFTPNELHHIRWAAALLAFCFLGKIALYDSLSAIEYADAHGDLAAQKANELFQKIYSIEVQELIDFALGKRDEVAMPKTATSHLLSLEQLAEEREGRFLMFYACMIKIAIIATQDSGEVSKVEALIKWMHEDFVFVSAAYAYALIYFSSNSCKRMFKGFEEKYLRNAAWDLYLVWNWRKLTLRHQNEDTHVFLLSRDKAMIEIAKFQMFEEIEHRNILIEARWGRKSQAILKATKLYDELSSQVMLDSGRGERLKPENLKQRINELLDDLCRVLRERM